MGRKTVTFWVILLILTGLPLSASVGGHGKATPTITVALAQTATVTAYLAGLQDVTSDYVRIDVAPRGYEYVTIHVNKPGATISIIAFIFEPVKSSFFCSSAGIIESSIDIEIIRPDGTLKLPKQRYVGKFGYMFTTSMAGDYIILLDNSYSETTKHVYLAITTTVTQTKTTETETDNLLAVALLLAWFAVGVVVGYATARRRVRGSSGT